jgi:anti-sigma regulatory factor (Ser/Thr protein kinase)
VTREAPILSVPGRLAAVPRIRRWAAERLAEWHVSPRVIDDLLVALSEVCTNIIRHGYRDRSGEIRLRAAKRGGAIHVTVEDDAPPFIPEGAEAPPPESLAEGGYGLSLIHGLADRVEHRALGARGNRTTLVKRLPVRRRQ